MIQGMLVMGVRRTAPLARAVVRVPTALLAALLGALVLCARVEASPLLGVEASAASAAQVQTGAVYSLGPAVLPKSSAPAQAVAGSVQSVGSQAASSVGSVSPSAGAQLARVSEGATRAVTQAASSSAPVLHAAETQVQGTASPLRKGAVPAAQAVFGHAVAALPAPTGALGDQVTGAVAGAVHELGPGPRGAGAPSPGRTALEAVTRRPRQPGVAPATGSARAPALIGVGGPAQSGPGGPGAPPPPLLQAEASPPTAASAPPCAAALLGPAPPRACAAARVGARGARPQPAAAPGALGAPPPAGPAEPGGRAIRAAAGNAPGDAGSLVGAIGSGLAAVATGASGLALTITLALAALLLPGLRRASRRLHPLHQRRSAVSFALVPERPG
jgi:translation initiation factor IF-2